MVTRKRGSHDWPCHLWRYQGYGGNSGSPLPFGDGFVASLSPDGQSLVYSTYLGGSAGSRSVGLLPNGSEHAVIVLTTNSPDFPVPLSASSCSPEQNVIVTFALDGRVVRSGTFILGDASASVRDITRDSNGVLYIVGSVGSAGLPTVHPLQAHLNGYSDAFVAKIDLQAAPGRVIWPLPYDGTYANQAFRKLWERSNMPVASGLARRSWIWGPAPITAGFYIPQVFADFFTQRGVISTNQGDIVGPVMRDWVYVVGLPLSEPYRVRARIGGVERDVLVQVGCARQDNDRIAAVAKKQRYSKPKLFVHAAGVFQAMPLDM